MLEEPLTREVASPATSLVLISRQRLFCECLQSRFDGSEAFSVAGRSGDLEQGIAQARRRGAQLLLVDGSSLDERGYSLLAELEDLKTVVLGLTGGFSELQRCAEAGVAGFAYRDTPFEELTETLTAVARGRRVCGARATRELFTLLGRLGRRDRRHAQMDALRLTGRQMEVLRLMAKGLGNLEIAQRLGLSHYTVKNHVHNILERLGVKDRTEAVAYAYRHRWLEGS